MPHSPGVALPAEFRTVGPGLISVHEDLFLCSSRELHHSGYLAKRSLRQTLDNDVGACGQFTCTADSGEVFLKLNLIAEL